MREGRENINGRSKKRKKEKQVVLEADPDRDNDERQPRGLDVNEPANHHPSLTCHFLTQASIIQK